jgi:hypothetical protein
VSGLTSKAPTAAPTKAPLQLPQQHRQKLRQLHPYHLRQKHRRRPPTTLTSYRMCGASHTSNSTKNGCLYTEDTATHFDTSTFAYIQPTSTHISNAGSRRHRNKSLTRRKPPLNDRTISVLPELPTAKCSFPKQGSDDVSREPCGAALRSSCPTRSQSADLNGRTPPASTTLAPTSS